MIRRRRLFWWYSGRTLKYEATVAPPVFVLSSPSFYVTGGNLRPSSIRQFHPNQSPLS